MNLLGEEQYSQGFRHMRNLNWETDVWDPDNSQAYSGIHVPDTRSRGNPIRKGLLNNQE